METSSSPPPTAERRNLLVHPNYNEATSHKRRRTCVDEITDLGVTFSLNKLMVRCLKRSTNESCPHGSGGGVTKRATRFY